MIAPAFTMHPSPIRARRNTLRHVIAPEHWQAFEAGTRFRLLQTIDEAMGRRAAGSLGNPTRFNRKSSVSEN